MINSGIRLKKDVDWEVLDKYGDFGEKCLISGIDDIPDNLKWWSYWRNVSRNGFIEAIEINENLKLVKDKKILIKTYSKKNFKPNLKMCA